MTEISKYITIIRPEFMSFCKDACRAAAFNHLLYRIAGKAKTQPREKIQAGEVLFYAKTELLTAEMSDAWGVCKVRKEVNELINMGLVGKTKDPDWGANRTKHFFFGSDQCEVFLKCCEENHVCFVHLDLPDETKHLIYLSLANDKSIECSCEKGRANDKSIECKSYIHQMEAMNVSDANDKSIEAITKTTTKTSNKDNSKEEGTYGAGATDNPAPSGTDVPTPAPDASDEPYQPDFAAHEKSIRIASSTPEEAHGDDLTHPDRVVGPGVVSAHDMAQHRSQGTPQSPARHTGHDVRLQPARTDQASSSGCAERGAGTARTGTAGHGMNSATVGPAGEGGYTQEKPVQATLMGTPETKKPASARTRKTTSEKKSEPLTIPPMDAEWNTTTCLRLFDAWRGAPLLAKHQLMDASHCAKGLAENYTRQQVELARRWMIERDPYWSPKPSAVDVCTVARHIHQVLADIEAARKAKRSAALPAANPEIEALRAIARRYSAPAEGTL